MFYVCFLRDCASLLDKTYKMADDKLYTIARLVAESDSVGECWRYKKDGYSRESFE